MNGRRHLMPWERGVLIASNVALVVAVLIATSPWTSGAYTWLAQRRLQAAVAPAAPRPHRAAARPSAESTRDPVWDGWEREDARDWRLAAEGSGIGRLAIPGIGVDVALVKGVAEADLRLGPGWVMGTSAPGPTGNCGISGHRTTFLAPFRAIDRLKAGDTVRIETRWRRYTYRVQQRFFADPNDSTIMLPTPAPTLTLTSCHPPYSDRFRIVVQARLVKTERR
jgi:LPXTG-site transpeptidase (sortase) family protein